MTGSREIRSVFAEHGLAPKKWLGQNLVKSSRYLSRIVDAAQVRPGESIVEIGAGLGALTKSLMDAGATVWALEIDQGFYRVLEERFQEHGNPVLLHVDALKYDFGSLFERLGPLKVVANLPYHISSRLLFRFHEHSELFDSLCILLQKEVADRLIAAPGTKDYGILTVLLGTSATIVPCFDVPATAFFPVPKVTSTLIRVTFTRPAPIRVRDKALMVLLVKAAFSERRKTLRNALKNLRVPGVTEDLLNRAAEQAQVDLRRRAESLSPGEFAVFADAIWERSKRSSHAP
ncbi:MAG: 16S rRNA (adenine(1518)-N(6)/adenine(1519)-N(6))-dimethyltransferase RsmA [Thermodesulfobacteriota bacterium]